MRLIKGIFAFYRDGFRSMTVGRKLWLVIGIKLLVILIVLKMFIYNKSLNTEFQTTQQKTQFVTENLIKP